MSCVMQAVTNRTDYTKDDAVVKQVRNALAIAVQDAFAA